MINLHYTSYVMGIYNRCGWMHIGYALIYSTRWLPRPTNVFKHISFASLVDIP